MFKKGDKVRCIDSEYRNLTEGDIYEVANSEYTAGGGDTFIQVKNDSGTVEEFWASRFELVEEEKQMYEASDIKVGQVLLCVDNGGFQFWTTGKRYEVVADEQGKPCLYSDSGEQPLTHRTANDISVYLNSQPNNGDVVMQIVEDEEEEQKMYKEEDIYAGMKLECVSDGGYTHWTEGKVYVVNEYFQIHSDEDSSRETPTILLYLNEVDNKKVRFKVVEKKGYTLDDLKEGMVLRCTDDRGYEFWTTGKEYTVYKDKKGLYITNDLGENSRNQTLLNRLNSKGSNVTMEVVSKPEESEEITLTIKGKTFYDIRSEAEELLNLVNSIIEASEELGISEEKVKRIYGGAK